MKSNLKTSTNEILLKIYLSKHCESFAVKVDEKEIVKKLELRGFVTIGLDISDKIEIIITKDDFEKNKKNHGIKQTMKFFAPFNMIDNCDNYPDKSTENKIQLRIKEFIP